MLAQKEEVRTLQFVFRWPVKQTGPTAVEVQIPCGEGPGPINLDFINRYGLSYSEVYAAEDAALRSLAIVNP